MSNSNRIFHWATTVALAGFLFGFDTVVISGANLPIKTLWNTSPWFHGTFIMSMALWGTVIGALFANVPTDRMGRKKTLFWIGIFYAISALGSAMAPDPYTFSFFRFLGGLGVGASSVAAPTYISEVAPSSMRGRLVARYQFMIVFGILVAFFSNYLLAGIGGEMDWRLMLGVEAVPAIIYCMMVPSIPNSPRWLVLHKNDELTAKNILISAGIDQVDRAISNIKESVKVASSDKLWSKKYKFPLLLAFFIALFNQLSGINFILYYAPEILEKAGLATKESLFSSISIGFVNLIFTLFGMILIDRAGRKLLMYIGSVGYIVSLGMVSFLFLTNSTPEILLVFLLMFIGAHAVGQGAVIWVFISEIFPNAMRARGQSFGAGVHWVMAAAITLLTPVFLDSQSGIFRDNPWPIFAFFCICTILQLIFVALFMPETKGKNLEEIENELVRE